MGRMPRALMHTQPCLPVTKECLARQRHVLVASSYAVLAPQSGLGGGMASHSSRLPALKRYLQALHG
jgi:hypothetical protein